MPLTPLELATKYLGEHEIAGKRDNQFILDCFKHTSYRASHDEVPWCAAFVCRILEDCGLKSTGSAAAVSFADYGTKSALVPGAIIVFEWADGSHHVSFCHHVVNNDYVAAIGGNQKDSVCIEVFNRRYIKAIRWPVNL